MGLDLTKDPPPAVRGVLEAAGAGREATPAEDVRSQKPDHMTSRVRPHDLAAIRESEGERETGERKRLTRKREIEGERDIDRLERERER